MRLREFLSERPMGSGGGGLGQQIAIGAGTLAGTVNDYVQLLFKWRAERLAKVKAKTAKEKAVAAKKEKETKTKLEKVASKMDPKEKEVAKKEIAKKEVEKSHSTASPYTGPTVRLKRGQVARSYAKQGGDGQDYTFHGKQWVSNKTGRIAKRDVAHTLFKQFLP